MSETTEPRGPVTHELKCVAPFFQDVWEMQKRFEVRKATDRDFRVGDTLRLFEWCELGYSGRTCRRKVVYILTHEQYSEGIQPGYVVMGLELT